MTRIHRISAAAVLCLVLVSAAPAVFAAASRSAAPRPASSRSAASRSDDQMEWTRRFVRIIRHLTKGIFTSNDEVSIPKP